MFWSLPPSTIGRDLAEVKKYASVHSLPFNEEDWSSIWFSYGVKLGEDNGLMPTASKSMGSIISLCFTGLPLSCGTDAFFDEEEIEMIVLNELLSISEEDLGFKEKSDKLLEFICDFYKNQLEDYTYLHKRVSVRLSINDLELLYGVDGGSLSERVRNAIRLLES